jgi:hypothetical protein
VDEGSGADHVVARTFASAQWLRFVFDTDMWPIETEGGAVVGQCRFQIANRPVQRRRIGTRLDIQTPHGEAIFSVEQQGRTMNPDCNFRALTADGTPIGDFREPWIYGRYNRPVGFVRRCKRKLTTSAPGDYEVTAEETDARLALLHDAGTDTPTVEFLAPVDTAFRALIVAAAFGLWRRVDERPQGHGA